MTIMNAAFLTLTDLPLPTPTPLRGDEGYFSWMLECVRSFLRGLLLETMVFMDTAKHRGFHETSFLEDQPPPGRGNAWNTSQHLSWSASKLACLGIHLKTPKEVVAPGSHYRLFVRVNSTADMLKALWVVLDILAMQTMGVVSVRHSSPLVGLSFKWRSVENPVYPVHTSSNPEPMSHRSEESCRWSKRGTCICDTREPWWIFSLEQTLNSAPVKTERLH